MQSAGLTALQHAAEHPPRAVGRSLCTKLRRAFRTGRPQTARERKGAAVRRDGIGWASDRLGGLADSAHLRAIVALI